MTRSRAVMVSRRRRPLVRLARVANDAAMAVILLCRAPSSVAIVAASAADDSLACLHTEKKRLVPVE